MERQRIPAHLEAEDSASSSNNNSLPGLEEVALVRLHQPRAAASLELLQRIRRLEETPIREHLALPLPLERLREACLDRQHLPILEEACLGHLRRTLHLAKDKQTLPLDSQLNSSKIRDSEHLAQHRRRTLLAQRQLLAPLELLHRRRMCLAQRQRLADLELRLQQQMPLERRRLLAPLARPLLWVAAAACLVRRRQLLLAAAYLVVRHRRWARLWDSPVPAAAQELAQLHIK